MAEQFTPEQMAPLYIGLIQFQSDCPPITKTATNPFFHSKYAPLDKILRIVRPILADNNLGLTFPPDVLHDGSQVLCCRLVHTSGVYLEGKELIKPEITTSTDKKTGETTQAIKDTPQTQGSATTYKMRNIVRAILGIATEDDDDGNAASGKDYNKPANTGSNSNTHNQPPSKPKTDLEKDNDKYFAVTNYAFEDDKDRQFWQAALLGDAKEHTTTWNTTDFDKAITQFKIDSLDYTTTEKAKDRIQKLGNQLHFDSLGSAIKAALKTEVESLDALTFTQARQIIDLWTPMAKKMEASSQ